ncbi:MAG TPA: hypothetical protein DCS93_23195 [Microscillaceae bacterium]|nr:hypothetical protein [Microscillaceae bacterium]
MKINTEELLKQAKADAQEDLKVAKESFDHLTEEELYWQPAPGKWSVGECLEHLNITSRNYMPKIKVGIQQGLEKGWQAQGIFKTGLIGQNFTNSFRLDENNQPRRRVKTFKSFEPNNLPQRNPRVREEFAENMAQFIAQIDQAAQVNLNKVKITSAIGPIFRFRLGDVFRFLNVHTHRHLIQAQRVVLLSEKQRRPSP